MKVLDFGISKFVAAAAMTQTSTMLGSPLYMSPEQMMSARTIDARTDVWSLGIVLYELLSGEIPFMGENVVQLAFNVRERTPRPLEELASVPPALAAVVRRCLEKDPAHRYEDVKTLAADLAPFATPEAALLAERLSGARGPASNPELMATTPGAPGVRDLAAASGPVVFDESASRTAKSAGSITFAPLQSTQGGGAPGTGSSRMRMARLAVVAASALAAATVVVALTSGRGTRANAEEPLPKSPASAASASETPASSTPMPEPPLAVVPASGAATATATAVVAPSVTASSRRIVKNATPAASTGSVSASVAPPPPDAPASSSTVKKGRALDRDVPF